MSDYPFRIQVDGEWYVGGVDWAKDAKPDPWADLRAALAQPRVSIRAMAGMTDRTHLPSWLAVRIEQEIAAGRMNREDLESQFGEIGYWDPERRETTYAGFEPAAAIIDPEGEGDRVFVQYHNLTEGAVPFSAEAPKSRQERRRGRRRSTFEEQLRDRPR